jgi:hypothetical protein
MQSVSNQEQENRGMLQRTRKHWLVVILMSAFVGACVTYGGIRGHVDRGLKPVHQVHAKQNMGCTDCHNEEKGEPAIPGHDVCVVCHEFNVDKPDPKACGFCHTKPDYTITPLQKRLTDESKFSHAPHSAKKVECKTCHADPDARELPKGNLMQFCIDCHAKTDKQLTDCAVCHKEMSKNTKPQYHGKQRIMHDAPQIWETMHGPESRKDPAFCNMCHERETFCEDCHRKTQPKDHTIAWRKKPHGQRAMWDRERCMVCHEEDSCIKCHKHSEPTSHRGGWGGPLNRHCISCHYPPGKTECAVCHEKIEHEKALPSPHLLGIYPPHCGLCHPLGLPNHAPHLMNSTVRCLVCHGGR